ALRSGKLIDECGSYIVTEKVIGLQARANIEITFLSTEQKRDFKKKVSGSAEGSYGDVASGGVEGSQQLHNTLRQYNLDRNITIKYYSRSKSGTTLAGEAVAALGKADENPFAAVWNTVGKLLEGLKNDAGIPVAVTFEPIFTVVQRTPEGSKM